MNRHSTIHIEEVENGLLVHITDDFTRKRDIEFGKGHGGTSVIDMGAIATALKPVVYIATTVEEATKRILEYYNHREDKGEGRGD